MDRDAILARRALFVASALSSLLGPRTLAAEPDAVCPRKVPSSDEIAAAHELYKQGVVQSKAGDYAGALERMEQAYVLAPLPKILVSIAQLARENEDWVRAFTRARLALSCPETELGEGRALAQQIVEEAEGRIGRVVIRTVPDGAELEVDDQVVGTTPLAEPLIVNPGEHTLTARWPRGAEARSQSIVISAGQELTVDLAAPPDECWNEPCVCLQPCLAPPFKEHRARFGAGLGYTFWLDTIDDDVDNDGHGLNARAFYELPFGDIAVLQAGLGVTPTRLPDGTLVPVGADIALLAKPDPFVVGLELSAGYLFADDPIARSSAFVESKLVLGYAVSEQVVIGARAGSFLSLREDALRPSWLSVGAFLTYTFGLACHEDGYPVHCEEPEHAAEASR
jgi:hypothetical protein